MNNETKKDKAITAICLFFQGLILLFFYSYSIYYPIAGTLLVLLSTFLYLSKNRFYNIIIAIAIIVLSIIAILLFVLLLIFTVKIYSDIPIYVFVIAIPFVNILLSVNTLKKLYADKKSTWHN